MNRFVAIEYLKTYFGTLFLVGYMFPTHERLTELLFQTWNKLIRKKSFQTLHALGYLQKLVKFVLQHEDDLIAMSKNNFLKKHSDRVLSSAVVFPYNERRSVEMFFINFLNADYCPQNEDELKDIIQWSLLVVQFEEANVDRTHTALTFLKTVQSSIDRHMNTIRDRDFKLTKDNVIVSDNDDDDKYSVFGDDDDEEVMSSF